MFLSEKSFLEINKIFAPPEPLEPVDKDNIIQNMNSLYELEDYIKEKIYDKKYPGLLSEINNNLSSLDEESYEDEYENNENYKKIEFDIKQSNAELVKDKKYIINSNQKDIITFNSNNYSTDDKDEFDSIELLNEDRAEGNEKGWVLNSDKDNIKVYYKVMKIKTDGDKEIDSLAFYVEAIINITSSKLINYLNDFKFREEFDKVYSQTKILKENNDEKNDIKIIDYYFYMKMPFMITDRDFVVRKKIWSDYDNKKGCYLIHIKSVENSEYPEKSKPVRAKFIIRTGYICPFFDEKEGEKCKLYLATCFDMKMNFGISMMKSKGSDGQRKWVEDFIKNINKHENNS